MEMIKLAAGSIPFIAGQWSLLPRSPYGGRGVRRKFNPLHCGAVVASPHCPLSGASGSGTVQSPSLRGSGRFSPACRRRAGFRGKGSIPFIAGQWSLLASTS